MKMIRLTTVFTFCANVVLAQMHLTNGLKITGASEANGKVLTSDANGNATWQNPLSYWQLSGNTGNELRNTNTGGFWSSYPTTLSPNADNISNPPTMPASGNGTRFAWIPSRSAFNSGTFNLGDGSVRFISENVGLFSFCSGLNVEARSRGGVAFGMGAIADGTSNTLAFGENVVASGTNTIVWGQNCTANANNSIIGGFGSSITDGTSNTILFGESSVSNTNRGYGFGRGLNVNTYSSVVMGYYNNPFVGTSTTNWVGTEPLFILGNGQDDLSRSNAMVVLKNGKVGIGSDSPQNLLHVYQSASGAVMNSNSIASFESQNNGYVSVLTPENRESGISFGLPSSNVSGGIYYNTLSDKRMTFRTNGNSTKMTLLANGNLGIGITSPVNPLHLHNSTGVEALLRFTNMNSGSSINDGIEVGYQSDGTGKMFIKENKGLILGTNNVTRINILSSGEVGIGTTSTPAAKLDVNGTTKIGTNGSILNEIIKTTFTDDIPSIAAKSSYTKTLSVPNTQIGSTVYVSPSGDLTDGIVIAYARVSIAGTVLVRFTNITDTAINPALMDYYVTVIR